MKKIITILSVLFFLCSSILFSASLCARNILNDTFGTMVVKQLNLKERVRSAIDEQLSQNAFLADLTTNAVVSIMESEELSKQFGQYGEMLLADLVCEEANGEEFEMMVKESLQEGLNDLTIPDNSFFTKEQMIDQIGDAIDQINFSTLYEQLLSQVRNQLTPAQFQLLRQFMIVRSDGFYYVTLVMMVICAMLFFLQGLRKGLRNLALSSMLVSMMIGVLWMMGSFLADRLEIEMFGALIKTSIQPMMNICGGFFILAVLSFVAQAIYQKVAVH